MRFSDSQSILFGFYGVACANVKTCKVGEKCKRGILGYTTPLWFKFQLSIAYVLFFSNVLKSSTASDFHRFCVLIIYHQDSASKTN